MLIGKSLQQLYKEGVEKFHNSLKQMVPVRVFAVLPKRLKNGQRAWLCDVWKVSYDFSKVLGNRPTRVAYFADRESALLFSRERNYELCSDQDVIKYAHIHLYK